MPLPAGTRLGPYEIQATLGAGGMGEVYRAHDTRLGRDIALKILPESFAADADRVARFRREAQVLASLNHPHIAHIHGLEDLSGSQFLVLELVDGPTLADRLAHGPLPIDEALSIAKQIAEALEAAHEQGIIHRDLKPANIKLRADGTVKVLDFGLAKTTEPAGAGSVVASVSPTITTPAMTQAGVVLGTAAYMSPEQAKGRPLDRRSDVWAFGAVVYELLAGRRPFNGEDLADTLAAVLMKEPDWNALPAGTPPAVVTALQRCLVKDRTLRIRDIGDAMMALGGAFDTTRNVTVAPAAVRPTPVWRRLVPIALMMAAIASIAAFATWRLARRTPEPVSVVRLTIVPAENARLGGLPRDRNLVISPDGSQIVYTSNVPGSNPGSTIGVVVRRPLDRFGAAPISISIVSKSGSTGGVEAPFFSPDGKWLGFVDSATGQVLQRAPIGGGLPFTIATPPVGIRGAAWDNDNQIVFGTSTAGLFRVSADGGEPVALAKPDQNTSKAYRWPFVIRQRRAVLFTIADTTVSADANQLAVLDLASGAVTRLGVQGTSPQYVSTGHLVYAAADGTLRAVRFDLQSLRVVGKAVTLVEGADVKTTGAANYAISESGSLVYATGAATQPLRTLAFVDPDGQRHPLAVPPDTYAGLRLSPDGKTVAVQTTNERGPAQLWTYELFGKSQIQQLTFKGNNTRPIWTPDGKQITFASDRDGPMSLYWQPADGHAEAERLTTGAQGETQSPGSWSPGGVLTFMTQRGNDFIISTLSRSSAGWQTKPLLGGDGRVYLAPEFSSDGKWLAYGSGSVYTAQDIYVEPFPRTGQVIRITRGEGYWPFWSRNTDRLFFRSISTSLDNRLRWVAVETKPSFRFSNESVLPVTGFNVVTLSRDYDITPDGKRLLMVFPNEQKANEAGLLNVVLNWTEELKKVGGDTK